MHGLVNDPYFVLLILFCAAVITIGAIVTALSRIPRVKFAQLQNELKTLSQRVGALEAAEQRRFLRELNSHGPRPEIALTPGTGERKQPAPSVISSDETTDLARLSEHP